MAFNSRLTTLQQAAASISITLGIVIAGMVPVYSDSEFTQTKSPVAHTTKQPVSDNKNKITIGGYIKFWYLHEQTENDSQQALTGNYSPDETSGFSLNKARVFINSSASRLFGRLELKLEKNTPLLLDAYAGYFVSKNHLKIIAGQMKIPSTYEVQQANTRLDFITRSMFSAKISDWSLSKSISSVSPFTGVNTYQRDLGIAAKSSARGLSCFVMISNGFGAHNYVGGNEDKQFVYTNRFGEFFYGVRVQAEFIPLFQVTDKILTRFNVGGHYNYNKHDDILYNDQKSVYDINRSSWSTDISISFFDRVHIAALYGAGTIDDDFDKDNNRDLYYKGSELKISIDIIREQLSCGFRYDTYTEKNSIFGGLSVFKNYTFGFTLIPHDQLKIQTNYKLKYIESDLQQDPDDNIFIVMLQYSLASSTPIKE